MTLFIKFLGIVTGTIPVFLIITNFSFPVIMSTS